MDERAQEISIMTAAFYEAHADSFSSTRNAPWNGWRKVLQHLPDPGFSLLDVASGNLRFERFLHDSGHVPSEVLAVDSCAALLESEVSADMKVVRVEADIIFRLHDDSPLAGGDAVFDAAVCFGFMHHVPTDALRRTLLRKLLASVHQGGVVIISFWQMHKDDRLMARAQKAEASQEGSLAPELDEGDHYLGWQGDTSHLRLCHRFAAEEISTLVDEACERDASLLDAFNADGASDDLNRYIVLRRSS